MRFIVHCKHYKCQPVERGETPNVCSACVCLIYIVYQWLTLAYVYIIPFFINLLQPKPLNLHPLIPKLLWVMILWPPHFCSISSFKSSAPFSPYKPHTHQNTRILYFLEYIIQPLQPTTTYYLTCPLLFTLRSVFPSNPHYLAIWLRS